MKPFTKQIDLDVEKRPSGRSRDVSNRGVLGTAIGSSLAERYEVSAGYSGILGGLAGVVIGGIFLWQLSKKSSASTSLMNTTVAQLNEQVLH